MKDVDAQRSVSCVFEKVDRGGSGKEGWYVDSSSSILLENEGVEDKRSSEDDLAS